MSDSDRPTFSLTSLRTRSEREAHKTNQRPPIRFAFTPPFYTFLLWNSNAFSSRFPFFFFFFLRKEDRREGEIVFTFCCFFFLLHQRTLGLWCVVVFSRRARDSLRMSNRPKFTITLGNSGRKVVKRDGYDAEVSHTSSRNAGSKRSVMDRLGGYNGYSSSKRRQRGNDKWANKDADMDINSQNVSTHLYQDDLRLTLLRGRLSRRMTTTHDKQKGKDFHERHSATNQDNLRHNERDYTSMSNGPIHLRRSHAERSADDFPQTESPRKSYAWNGFGNKSPERLLCASRVVSPSQATDMGRNSMGSSMLMPFIPTSTANVEAQTPVMHFPPPGLGPARSSFPFDEQPTVGGLLNALGLGKYSLIFQAEEIDMAALKQMTDSDLKDLGIPMGPRKKILLAIAPRPRSRPR